MQRWTLKTATAHLRRYGVTLSRCHVDGEYRVNLRNGTETTAYYTSDLDDAVDTGVVMANHN